MGIKPHRHVGGIPNVNNGSERKCIKPKILMTNYSHFDYYMTSVLHPRKPRVCKHSKAKYNVTLLKQYTSNMAAVDKMT